MAKPGFWGRLLRSVEGEPADPSDVVSELEEARVIRRVARDPGAAIARECALGYDLIVLGATETGEGTFSSVIDRVLARVEVPSVVVRFPANHTIEEGLPQRIIVPVSATRSTRAAEEFAYSIAGAASGQAFALHVVNRPEGQGVLLEEPTVDESLRAGQELVGDGGSVWSTPWRSGGDRGEGGTECRGGDRQIRQLGRVRAVGDRRIHPFVDRSSFLRTSCFVHTRQGGLAGRGCGAASNPNPSCACSLNRRPTPYSARPDTGL